VKCGGEGRLYNSKYGGNDPDVSDAGQCDACNGTGLDVPSSHERSTPYFKLMTHENRFGYGVNLVKYVGGELATGFALHYLPSKEARETYLRDLAEMTGFEVDEF
jgi:hypothetical protein